MEEVIYMNENKTNINWDISTYAKTHLNPDKIIILSI